MTSVCLGRRIQVAVVVMLFAVDGAEGWAFREPIGVGSEGGAGSVVKAGASRRRLNRALESGGCLSSPGFSFSRSRRRRRCRSISSTLICKSEYRIKSASTL